MSKNYSKKTREVRVFVIDVVDSYRVSPNPLRVNISHQLRVNLKTLTS